jgi:hypothetical protein
MKKILVLILLVVLPIALISLTVWETWNDGNKTANAPRLDLNIEIGGIFLEIKNNENSNLQTCNLTINDVYHGAVNVGTEPTKYNLSSFTKDDGERFDPISYKVKSIHVSDCSGQPGRESFYTN